jgi:hypothetical protein
VAPGALHEGNAAALGHAVDLIDRHAENPKEQQHLRRHGRAAAEAATHFVDAEEALQATEAGKPQEREEEAIAQIGQRAAIREPPLGNRPAELHANLEDAALQRRGVADAIVDALLHLLPDARHAKKSLRRDLAEIDDDGIDRFREAHHAAGEKLHDGGEAPLRHMAEGQIAEHRIVLRVEPEHRDDPHRSVHHVAMAEHRAFRHASCAGGIDDDRGVVRFAGGKGGIDRSAQFGLLALAQRHHGGKRHQAVLLVVAHALHIDADDGGQIGQPAFVALRIEHLVGLLLIAAHDGLGPRVAQDVLQLRPWIGRVNAEAGAADRLRRKIGIEPFRRVVARHRQAIAGAEAQRIEPDREKPGILKIFAPARAPPHTEILLAQRQMLALRLGAILQHLRHGHERKTL